MAKSPSPGKYYSKGVGNKYQKDAHYLAAIIREAYPRLNDKMEAEQFDKEIAGFIGACKNMINDSEFATATQRFMAKLKDGHSRSSSVAFNEKGSKRYTISLFVEGDRFLVANIDRSADSSLIGRPVIAINDIPIHTVQERIVAFESAENEYFAFNRFQSRAGFPAYWKAIGVTRDLQDHLAITILNSDGQPVSVQLAPKPDYHFYKVRFDRSKYPFTRQQNTGFYYKILETEKIGYLQMNTCLDFVAVKSEISNYTNFLTKPLALHLMKKRTKDARNFGLVLQQFFREADQKGIQTVVLDLRYNTGGDERLGKQFIWYLTDRDDLKGFREYYQISGYFKQQVRKDYRNYAHLYRQKYGANLPADTLLDVTSSIFDNPPYFQDIEKPGSPFLLDAGIPKFKGRVYVLTASRTFSAAQVLATTLRDNGLAVIVGSPAGNKPSTQTGASLFKLPHTKTIVSLSYLYMERPDTSKNKEDALYPDISIERTFQKVRHGHDEPFEWILEHHTDKK